MFISLECWTDVHHVDMYMQYAECFSGIQYDNWKGERWIDIGKRWLDGSMTMGCKQGEELKALVEGREVGRGDTRK